MPTRLKYGRAVLLLGLLALLGRGYADTVDVHQLKAAFVFKFAQFTTWSTPPAGESFTICLEGANARGGAFAMVAGKTLNDKPVEVKYLSSARSLDECQVAYLNPASQKELAEWMEKVDSLPILTVSDYPDASKENVMIEFISEPNRVAFKVNLSAVRRSGLSISARVLQLAQEVR